MCSSDLANPSAANAGNDQAVCGDTALLSATAPLIGSGVWSVSSGAGSFTGTTNPASVVLALNPGTNVLIWTTSNGTVCPSSSDTVIIQSLDLVSVAVAGTDQFLCAPDSVQLGATLPTNGTGAWNVLTSGVILSNTTSASTTATALKIGRAHV